MALTTVMNDTDHGYETRYMRYHFLPLRGEVERVVEVTLLRKVNGNVYSSVLLGKIKLSLALRIPFQYNHLQSALNIDYVL